jgi:hypothetical protein
LRPKSVLFAAESGGFGAEIGAQIANVAKNRGTATAYAQRTPWRMMLQK